jgi:hypothetical protein
MSSDTPIVDAETIESLPIDRNIKESSPNGVQSRHCTSCSSEQICLLEPEPRTLSITITCLSCGSEWTNYH